jgi:hypothetical protein
VTLRHARNAMNPMKYINTTSDVLELLKLIQKSMYTKSTNCHPTHALYKADATLMKFCQGDDMSNSDFLEKFKSLIDISIHASGDPGSATNCYRDFALDTEDPDNNDDDYKKAVNHCRDDWHGLGPQK